MRLRQQAETARKRSREPGLVSAYLSGLVVTTRGGDPAIHTLCCATRALAAWFIRPVSGMWVSTPHVHRQQRHVR